MTDHLAKVTFWAVITITIVLAVIIACVVNAEAWTDEQIVNAIYRAEDGAKAKVPYGILSVKVANAAEARRVCLNTVRNNRKRYADYGYKQYSDFLSFLASRYCPVGCDNDNGTNRFWLKNVRYFLAREK
jgi:hypothetical protein